MKLSVWWTTRAVAWPHLDGRDVAVFGQVLGSTKQRNRSRPLGSHRHLAGFRTRSGLPSCQPAANVRGGGASFGRPPAYPRPPTPPAWRFPFGGACDHCGRPAGGRLPRRHLAAFGIVANVVGPVDGLLVGHRGERADLAGAVALLTVILEDRQHVTVIGDLAGLLDRLVADEGTADGRRDRLAHRLAGEQVVEGLAQSWRLDVGFFLRRA